MKALKLMTVAAALVATSVSASTYNTTVNIDDLSTVIAWTETTSMQFPTLLLDGNTENGDTCYTAFNSVGYSELCPTDRSSTTSAIFTVTGTPNGNVGVTLDTTPQTVEGIKFIPYEDGSSLKLNASGTVTSPIHGSLELVDRNAITSSSINFTYNLEFVGQ